MLEIMVLVKDFGSQVHYVRKTEWSYIVKLLKHFDVCMHVYIIYMYVCVRYTQGIIRYERVSFSHPYSSVCLVYSLCVQILVKLWLE